MIKAVIFDWGGVIAKNPNGGWIKTLAKRLDLPYEEVKTHWFAAGYEDLSKGEMSSATFWKQLEKSLGRPLDFDTDTIWSEGSALKPWPEIMNFISELHHDKVRLAVLSNSVPYLSARLRELGMYDGFDEVVLSDEVGLMKPEPAIYQFMLDRLDLLAEECVFVDDIASNLIPAEELGMNTILVDDSPEHTILALRSVLS